MQDPGMQKYVRNRLPDETVNHGSWNQTEPDQPEISAFDAKKKFGYFLKQKHRNAGYTYRLDGRREIFSQIKPMTVSASKNGAHSAPSLKRQSTRVKASKVTARARGFTWIILR
jgi:hypothetical protein